MTHRALAEQLSGLDPADQQYASQFIDLMIAWARERGASDIHLQPTADGLEARFRVDGVLNTLGTFAAGDSTNIVTRLKVMAELLTYRSDVPQEGRLRVSDETVEVRVSTFPTIFGEKAVVRLFQSSARFNYLADLDLPADVLVRLRQLLAETSGAILITGPAGSGKTTTLYACLREMVRTSGSARSIAALEDPVEVVVEGVSQSQVNPAAGFDLAQGMRSIMRQDPQVIMIGEMRDRPTAEAALQASLTGQLVLTSFHAGNAAGAISRLTDMGIEPYAIRSGVLAVISQRLVRRLCECKRLAQGPEELLALPVRQAQTPVGCELCLGSGYRGRAVLAEMMLLDEPPIAREILARSGAAGLEQAAVAGGMIGLWERALAAVEGGVTSPAEVRRVMGFGSDPHPRAST